MPRTSQAHFPGATLSAGVEQARIEPYAPQTESLPCFVVVSKAEFESFILKKNLITE